MTELDQASALKAYEVAYHVIKASPGLLGQEHRKECRHPFKVLQPIAPYEGDLVPDESKFTPVRCRDLSQGGFSFIADEKPDFPTLVISLGDRPNQTHMVAEIVHFRRVRLLDDDQIEVLDDAEKDDDDEDEDDRGTRAFLVGCRFSGRLE